MTHLEKARELRARTDVHFNCCQSVLAAFAEDMGLTEEQAFNLGANFGSGMRCGSACGALTGGLMVAAGQLLGLLLGAGAFDLQLVNILLSHPVDAFLVPPLDQATQQLF